MFDIQLLSIHNIRCSLSFLSIDGTLLSQVIDLVFFDQKQKKTC